MKLYALAIKGYMFYFIGDIPESEYPAINEIASSISHNQDDIKFEEYLRCFSERVSNEIGINLTHIRIENVFRAKIPFD